MREILYLENMDDIKNIGFGRVFRAGIMGSPEFTRFHVHKLVDGFHTFVREDPNNKFSYAAINPYWITDKVKDLGQISVIENGVLLLNPAWMQEQEIKYCPINLERIKDLNGERDIRQAMRIIRGCAA